MQCHSCGYIFRKISCDAPLHSIACEACDITLELSEGKVITPINRVIENRKKSMHEELSKKGKANFNNLRQCAVEIRTNCPNDLLVEFCEKIADKKLNSTNSYEAFLFNPPNGTSNDYDMIFDYVISFLTFEEVDQVKAFIAKITQAESTRRDKFELKLKEAAAKIEIKTKPVKSITKSYENKNNIINRGYIAHSADGLEYFSNTNDGKVYVKNGNNIMVLCDDLGHSLNVVGDWVYFISLSDGLLYRMNTDGKNKKKVSDFTLRFINVMDDYVYCSNKTSGAGGSLIRIHVDSGQDVHFVRAGSGRCEYINVYGDYIYYRSDADDGKLYKINKDSYRERALVSSNDCLYVNILDDWVYYINASDCYKIYRVGINGENETLVCNDICRTINVSNGWVYYTTDLKTNHLYRRFPGPDANSVGDLICKDNCWNINVSGDWIYYHNRSDNNSLYKIKNNGSGRQKI